MILKLISLALSWIRGNATAKIYTSPTPLGHRLGGHDVQQLPDLYIILDVRAGGKILELGYFELT